MSSETSKNSQENWGPDNWDILGGPSSVLDAVQRKADVRGSFKPTELGVDAGRAVLDYYYAAKGEHSRGTAIRATLSFQNATHMAAMALPLAGVVAAVGVDAEIFGSAAQNLVSDPTLPFNAFAVGSLIFASALGISEKYDNTWKKRWLYAALFTASAGASFIAADNQDFRRHFTQSIASTFTAGSDDEQARVDALRIEIESLENRIQQNATRLSTGGNGGNHMLSDGSTGNDLQGEELNLEIRTLNSELRGKQSDLATATPQLTQAQRKDWTDFVGRLLATSYIAAWLIASQLLLAEIVRKASDTFKNFRETVLVRSKQKKFIDDIENPNDEKREKSIRSFVSVMLSHFSEKLSLSRIDPKYPDKHENFSQLYEEEPYEKMVVAGVGVVEGAITPRGDSVWSRIRPSRGLFNRKSSGENDSNTSRNKADANNKAEDVSHEGADPSPN